MAQNTWADLEDSLNEKDGPEAVAVVAVFLFFLWAWFHYGTFWGAVLMTVLAGGVVGGLAVLVVGITSMIFARRS
ncbi:hypothetical protein AGMMS50256_11620 [Betaproteobacteria bacterium]|nr:hypothetical protein AGMMS50256_11620 [Betaproteobacteria bacterium]